MDFRRIDPPNRLRNILECIWIAESHDPQPVLQKIIPDGFPEIIFHFGDPYRIKLKDKWELQSRSLLAGQITGHFFLENTGQSSMMGLKFKPAALTNLFEILMHPFTDAVVDLKNHEKLIGLETSVRIPGNYEMRTQRAIDFLAGIPELNEQVVGKSLELIFKSSGNINVTELCEACSVSERQLERLDKKYVGLSPKVYTRIIRFSRIFDMIKNEDHNWTQLGLEAGFYDQSHFIRDFKAFTGEDPSSYVFDDPGLGNLFMKK